MNHSKIITFFAAIGIFSIALLPVAGIVSCKTLTPQQQATITLTENILAKAAQIAAPLVSNKTLSNSLYAAAYVATAYGSQPVPTTVLQATAPIPGLAGTILPLVTGKANSPTTQAIIAGAAQILASLPGTTPVATAPVTTGT